MPENELVDQYIKHPDNEKFQEIYLRYKNQIFTYVKRVLYFSSNEIILEIVDEIFVKVYTKLPKLSNTESFKHWIYRIAHNYCVDHIKKKRIEILEEKDQLNQKIDNRINIEKDYIKQELNDYIMNIINKFDNQLREIIILKFYQGLTFKEISHITKIPIRTLKFKSRKALLELGAKLKKEGYY